MSTAFQWVKVVGHQAEIRLDQQCVVSVGQVLQFLPTSKQSVNLAIGEVIAFKTIDDADTLLIRLKLIYGQPSSKQNTLKWLSDNDLAEILQQKMGDIPAPFFFGGHFMGDLERLGAVTLFDGNTVDAIHAGLTQILDALQSHHRVLVIDPIGLFQLAEDYQVHTAGQDCRLSVNTLGVGQFFELVESTLPQIFRPQALQLLGQVIPSDNQFFAFKSLLDVQLYEDLPARNPLLSQLNQFFDDGLFADDEAQVMALDALINGQLNVLDLSAVPSRYRPLFYQRMMDLLAKQSVYDLVPVLIHPGQYLDCCEAVFHQLQEAQYKTFWVPFNAVSSRCNISADNELYWQYSLDQESVEVSLKGAMTLGLNLAASVDGLKETPADEVNALLEEHFDDVDFTDIESGIGNDPVAPPVVNLSLDQGESVLEKGDPPTEDKQLMKNLTQPSNDVLTLPVNLDPDDDRPDDSEVYWASESPTQELILTNEAPAERLIVIDTSQKNSADNVQETLADETSQSIESILASDSITVDETDDDDLLDFDFEPSLLATEPSEPLGIPSQQSPESEGRSYEINEPPFSEVEPNSELEAGLGLDDETLVGNNSNAISDSGEGLAHIDDDEFQVEAIEEPLLDVSQPSMDVPAEDASVDNGNEDDIYSRISALTDPDEGMALLDQDMDFDFSPELEENEAPDNQQSQLPLADEPDTHLTADYAEPEDEFEEEGDSEPESSMPVYQTVDPETEQLKEEMGYAEGDVVQHEKYGSGTIEKILPMDGRLTLKVVFESVGKRLLDAESKHLSK